MLCAGIFQSQESGKGTPLEILKHRKHVLQGGQQVRLPAQSVYTGHCPPTQPTAVTSLATQGLRLDGLPCP